MAKRIRSKHWSGFTELETETVCKDDTVKIKRRIRQYTLTEIDIEIKSYVTEDSGVQSRKSSSLTEKWLQVIGILVGSVSIILTIFTY